MIVDKAVHIAHVGKYGNTGPWLHLNLGDVCPPGHDLRTVLREPRGRAAAIAAWAEAVKAWDKGLLYAKGAREVPLAGASGVCIECATVLFLQRLTNMYGPGAIDGLPESLRLPHVQEQFAAVMRAGNSEASPDEIDWERVIEVWSIQAPSKETLF